MNGVEDFTDLQGNKVNDFIDSYRDSMKQSYDDNVADIQNQRRNDYASIMAQANKRGMMYSNFPERSKMQYDAETYLPKMASAYTTYQTGLSKLKSGVLDSYNAIKESEDNLNHLAELGKISDTSAAKKTWGKTWFPSDSDRKFYDDNYNPVKFSTWVRKNGYDNTSAGFLDAAKAYLSKNQYNQLLRIFESQKESQMPNLIYNANGFGNTPVTYDWSNGLTQEDIDFLNSLGLAFGQ